MSDHEPGKGDAWAKVWPAPPEPSRASSELGLRCGHCGYQPDATASLGEMCMVCNRDGYRMLSTNTPPPEASRAPSEQTDALRDADWYICPKCDEIATMKVGGIDCATCGTTCVRYTRAEPIEHALSEAQAELKDARTFAPPNAAGAHTMRALVEAVAEYKAALSTKDAEIARLTAEAHVLAELQLMASDAHTEAAAQCSRRWASWLMQEAGVCHAGNATLTVASAIANARRLLAPPSETDHAASSAPSEQTDDESDESAQFCKCGVFLPDVTDEIAQHRAGCQRFAPRRYIVRSDRIEMHEDREGNWVSWTDYDRLRAALSEAQAERETFRRSWQVERENVLLHKQREDNRIVALSTKDAEIARLTAENATLLDGIERVGITRGTIDSLEVWWWNDRDGNEPASATLADAADALWAEYQRVSQVARRIEKRTPPSETDHAV